MVNIHQPALCTEKYFYEIAKIDSEIALIKRTINGSCYFSILSQCSIKKFTHITNYLTKFVIINAIQNITLISYKPTA